MPTSISNNKQREWTSTDCKVVFLQIRALSDLAMNLLDEIKDEPLPESKEWREKLVTLAWALHDQVDHLEDVASSLKVI